MGCGVVVEMTIKVGGVAGDTLAASCLTRGASFQYTSAGGVTAATGRMEVCADKRRRKRRGVVAQRGGAIRRTGGGRVHLH